MVGAQFWVSFVWCNSTQPVKNAMQAIDVVHQMVAKYPDVFHWADSVASIREGFRKGKISSLIGLENGQGIGDSLGVLRLFYSLGVRYITLTHNCGNDGDDGGWAGGYDSDGNEKGPKGLTKFG